MIHRIEICLGGARVELALVFSFLGEEMAALATLCNLVERMGEHLTQHSLVTFRCLASLAPLY